MSLPRKVKCSTRMVLSLKAILLLTRMVTLPLSSVTGTKFSGLKKGLPLSTRAERSSPQVFL